MATLTKLLSKAPIKYQLVRSLTWLDPRLIVKPLTGGTKGQTDQLDISLRHLSDAGRLKVSECDAVRCQYRIFRDEVIADHSERFKDFDPAENRLDDLLVPILGQKYAQLWGVVEQILILSHGQATVERGFSISKETSVENLSKESFVAKRLILDALKKVGGAAKFPISKELLCSASSARKKYEEYLEEQRQMEAKQKAAQKRKAEDDEWERVKVKRRRLQEDISCLESSADKKALEAEQKENMRFLMESNALRRKVAEKKAEVELLDKQLKDAGK